MAYSHTNRKGTTYYLHVNERTGRDGRMIPLYFFARARRAAQAVAALPAGYEVIETATGLPVLRRPPPPPA